MSSSLNTNKNRKILINSIVPNSSQLAFPNLKKCKFRITSPQNDKYNCIAWAANDTSKKWWPDASCIYYWPNIAPRNNSLPAFLAAFQTIGYKHITNSDLELYNDVIAFMADTNNRITHAIRRINRDLWTSKLGDEWDIEHELHAIDGPIYGKICAFMGRNMVSVPQAENDC